MLVSIVIPAHNEEKNVVELTRQLQAELQKAKIRAEIIFVDDRSKDSTPQKLDALAKLHSNIRVIHRYDKPGVTGSQVGWAMIEGFNAAKGDVIVTMDADLSHSPADVPRLVKAVETSDIAMGSRYVQGGGAEFNLLRAVISRGFSFTARILLGKSLKDWTTGFRAHKAKVLKSLGLKSKGFSIHVEIPAKAIAMGYEVVEVPIVYRKRRYGSSKLVYSREGLHYGLVLLSAFFGRIRRLLGLGR